jgi:hypothetical protein
MIRVPLKSSYAEHRCTCVVPIAKLKDMKRKEEREESGSIHSIL